MAIGGDIGNIFLGIIVSVGQIGLILLMLSAWIPAYFYGIKYRLHIVIRERVGTHTISYNTKGGIIKNKKRGRSELRILKTKWNPFGFWEFPLLSDKYYHQGKRGKKFLEFYKAGELSTDLKPIPPINPNVLSILPTDIKIFDWTMQGFEKDARETRIAVDKFSKFAMVGVPLIIVAALVITFIYGLGTVETLQQGNIRIAGSLQEWGDRVVAVEEAKAGVQRIEAAKGDADVSEAEQVLSVIGVDLG